MFYAHFVLSKRGPLARIWLAAHWDKKLTKAHVFETNIDNSVEAIIKPKVKMALRTSGHLLLGVVRIYSRKAKYLLADCNEAFVKIKMAFRPGVVDLPEENREAAVATITLPETFHDFDTTMADLNDIDVQAQFSVNQSRPEEITMREDLGNITLIGDDGFGDMGFDDREMLRDAPIDDTLYKNPDSSNILLDNNVDKDTSAEKPMDIDFTGTAKQNDFEGGLEPLYGENFMEHGGLFEEAPVPDIPIAPEVETQKEATKEKEVVAEEPPQTEQTTVMRDQTTLVPNEAEAFALEPLDVTSLGTERKTKRKRKLIVDDHKGIPSETMKLQLSDTSDIVTSLDLAPPTKKLMHWKETGGVEKLFALSARPLVGKRINKIFSRNLITRPTDEKEEAEEEDRLELAPELPREEEAPAPAPAAAPAEDPAPIPQEDMTMPLEEPSRAEPVPPTPAPVEMSVASVAEHSVLEPETPAPAQAEPEPEDNDDIFMDNQLDMLEDSAADAGADGPTENVEDKRWSKRTHQMMHTLTRHLGQNDMTSFKELVQKNNRKQVASKFYTFLVLKKQQAVELTQHKPYGDIWISRGVKFDTVY